MARFTLRRSAGRSALKGGDALRDAAATPTAAAINATQTQAAAVRANRYWSSSSQAQTVTLSITVTKAATATQAQTVTVTTHEFVPPTTGGTFTLRKAAGRSALRGGDTLKGAPLVSTAIAATQAQAVAITWAPGVGAPLDATQTQTVTVAFHRNLLAGAELTITQPQAVTRERSPAIPMLPPTRFVLKRAAGWSALKGNFWALRAGWAVFGQVVARQTQRLTIGVARIRAVTTTQSQAVTITALHTRIRYGVDGAERSYADLFPAVGIYEQYGQSNTRTITIANSTPIVTITAQFVVRRALTITQPQTVTVNQAHDQATSTTQPQTVTITYGRQYARTITITQSQHVLTLILPAIPVIYAHDHNTIGAHGTSPTIGAHGHSPLTADAGTGQLDATATDEPLDAHGGPELVSALAGPHALPAEPADRHLDATENP